MLIYRKTSRAVDWKAVLWFALGVFVTLCVATYTHFDAAGGHAKASAATRAAEPLPATQPVTPVRTVEPSTRMSAGPGTAPAATPHATASHEGTPVTTQLARADMSLATPTDPGRREATPAAPTPDTATPLLAPDATSAHSLAPSQAETELENKLRSQSENTSAGAPSATDAAPLPHQKP